jgi:hypothetical protein
VNGPHTRASKKQDVDFATILEVEWAGVVKTHMLKGTRKFCTEVWKLAFQLSIRGWIHKNAFSTFPHNSFHENPRSASPVVALEEG